VQIPGQQSLILAGEYPPPGGRPASVVQGGLGLATNGAILKRVTAVVSRPNDTLVWLRADYGVALLPARIAAQHLNADAGTVLGDVGYSWAYLSATEQYARTQASLGDSRRGTVINVRA
jgi:hypothetical protein